MLPYNAEISDPTPVFSRDVVFGLFPVTASYQKTGEKGSQARNG